MIFIKQVTICVIMAPEVNEYGYADFLNEGIYLY